MITGKAALTEDEIKDLIVRECKESGVKTDPRIGWGAVDKLREHRASVGYPLPRGGCFLLGFESVLAGGMAAVHKGLCDGLNLQADSIEITPDVGENFSLQIKIQIPNDWRIPTALMLDRPELSAQQHIDEAIIRAKQWFVRDALSRLPTCTMIRTDVDNPVIKVKVKKIENGEGSFDKPSE